VHGNTATGSGGGEASGGGIVLSDGQLVVTNSAIYENKATAVSGQQALGGGIEVSTQPTSLSLENVTLSDNGATSDSGSSFGGGIETSNVPVSLKHVTMTGNFTSGGQGGNLYVGNFSTITFEDSIVAEGSAASGPNCKGVTGAPVTHGVNLSDDSSCSLPAGSPIAAPGLEPLGDHGGSGGSTRPPMPGSPALDAAASCAGGGQDQRGQAGPIGPACDLGAAELGADLSASLTASASSVSAGRSFTYVEVLRNDGLDATTAALEFTPPAGSKVTFANSPGGTCVGTAPVVCSYATVAGGQSVGATIVVTAPATGPMTATSRASGPLPDPNAANNTATATTNVRDTTKPLLSGLSGKLSRTKGGTIHYRLSENASLAIRLDRVVKGHRKGGRCTSAKRGKKCTRFVHVGTQRRGGKAGAHTLKLAALWGGKRPKRGKHRIAIVATDRSGNKAKAKALTVRVSR
jgi:hypothetical protein